MAREHTKAKAFAQMLMREARDCGWLYNRIEMKPDGTVIALSGMVEPEGNDDFCAEDLRMGK
ncbi:hypothetical protein [Pseudoprimorskyibacter insulae]|uniref:Uncharacterized protein n=1 Tax=Pseudoprimorskyibacter insulae TaxID=1695997 RepID=A0A2R8B0Y9_9RHOB|nr:hypothetical protein [Pseudoprimorskyibacter insulae]SPF81923.1 hypothetical protein PRI8871_03750 [Pseudoprimorskyibacter insulae]